MVSKLQADTRGDDAETSPWHRLSWQYGIAVGAIVIAVGVELLLASALRGETSYLFFLPAILIASAIGGWGPGLLATALGLTVALYFVADIYRANLMDKMKAGSLSDLVRMALIAGILGE